MEVAVNNEQGSFLQVGNSALRSVENSANLVQSIFRVQSMRPNLNAVSEEAKIAWGNINQLSTDLMKQTRQLPQQIHRLNTELQSLQEDLYEICRKARSQLERDQALNVSTLRGDLESLIHKLQGINDLANQLTALDENQLRKLMDDATSWIMTGPGFNNLRAYLSEVKTSNQMISDAFDKIAHLLDEQVKADVAVDLLQNQKEQLENARAAKKENIQISRRKIEQLEEQRKVMLAAKSSERAELSRKFNEDWERQVAEHKRRQQQIEQQQQALLAQRQQLFKNHSENVARLQNELESIK